MPDEATRERLREVRARRWNGEQLARALTRLGWTSGALSRLRGIGSRPDQRVTKTVKRWLADKNDIDPVEQEWLEQVLAMVEAGASLFEGPPGSMTAARFRELAWQLEWDVLVWKEGQARANRFASLADVFGVEQDRVQTIACGEEPVPKHLGDVLEAIAAGTHQHEENGGGGEDARQKEG